MKNYSLLLLVLVACFFSSCGKKNDVQVLYGKSFDEIKELATKENKPFFTILSNNDCSLCLTWLNQLLAIEGDGLAGTLINVVDVTLEENHWYKEWTMSTGVPTTCYFSPEGQLLAVFNGSAKNVQACLLASRQGDVSCAKFLFRFGGHYTKTKDGSIIEELNAILQCKLKLEKGEDIAAEIEELQTRVIYPYSLYLKCLNESKQGNEEQAKSTAKEILTFMHEPRNLSIYGSMFQKVKYIENPNYDPANSPNLALESDEIRLTNCEKNVSKAFKVKLTNTGKENLEIVGINLSCTCLTMRGATTFTIEPGGVAELDLAFVSEQSGVVSRNIHIYSNGTTPVKTILVKAHVN